MNRHALPDGRQLIWRMLGGRFEDPVLVDERSADRYPGGLRAHPGLAVAGGPSALAVVVHNTEVRLRYRYNDGRQQLVAEFELQEMPLNRLAHRRGYALRNGAQPRLVELHHRRFGVQPAQVRIGSQSELESSLRRLAQLKQEATDVINSVHNR